MMQHNARVTDESSQRTTSQCPNQVPQYTPPFDITTLWPESPEDLEYYERTCRPTGEKFGGAWCRKLQAMRKREKWDS